LVVQQGVQHDKFRLNQSLYEEANKLDVRLENSALGNTIRWRRNCTQCHLEL